MNLRELMNMLEIDSDPKLESMELSQQLVSS